MKVLHFIPFLDTVDDLSVSHYKPALIRSMSEFADVHVLTGKVADVSLGKAAVYGYSPLRNIAKGRCSCFEKFLSEIKPDIVHIHACWNIHAFYLYRRCMKKRIPVVITMDKQLEPWHVLHKYWFCKLPQLVAFQRYMLIKAKALHALTVQEKSDIMTFSWHPVLKSSKSLNERVVTINDFNRVNGMSAGEMSGLLIMMYQKVIDSNPFMFMTDKDSRAEDLLLAAGVSDMAAAPPVSDKDAVLLASLDNDSWRRILLHSKDQGIFDNIIKGAGILNVILPPFKMDHIDRFCHVSYHREKKFADKGKKKKENLMSDTSLSDIERDICIMLVDVLSKIRYSKIYRSDFAALYRILRFTDYNETRLRDKMRRLKMERPTARLFHVLKERYGLKEGFMFLEPLYDRKTKILTKMFFKSDIQ